MTTVGSSAPSALAPLSTRFRYVIPYAGCASATLADAVYPIYLGVLAFGSDPD